MTAKIKSVTAREVLDGVGFPAVEATIELENGLRASGFSPSGTSTGKFEALDLRDGDPKWYRGEGVSKAVSHINGEVAAALMGKEVADQKKIDRILCDLDGTNNKSRIGGNAIISVSLAAAKAGALTQGITLAEYLAEGKPGIYTMPWFHLVSGGIHVPKLGINSYVDFQEFEMAPVCAQNYREYFHLCWVLYYSIFKRLMKYCACYLLPIGAIAPAGIKTAEVIEQIVLGIEDIGLTAGKDVLLYLDVAASSFFKEGKYQLVNDGFVLSTDEMIEYIESIISRYPIYAVEDALDEDDINGWVALTNRIGNQVELIGDDFFVTSPDRIAEGIEKGAANASLIKINQVGTISEAKQAVKLAKQSGFRAVLSGRSREAETGVLPHIGLGFGTEEGKVGGVFGLGSNGNFNEFIRLEEAFGHSLEYAWKRVRR